MGWKGTLRSVRAAYRAAERDAQRRERELLKQEKEHAKMEALARARYEVEVYENRIDLLTSVHKEASQPINWKELASAPEPQEPEYTRGREAKALKKLQHFKPGIFARVLGRQEKAREKKRAAVDLAKEKDEAENKKRHIQWQRDQAEWRQETRLAKAVIAGDGAAKIEAIKHLNPFKDISDLGSQVSFSVEENGFLDATLEVHGDQVIPNEAKSLLQSGKLSTKKMPVGKFNELYQDYICSCALRVGNELMSLFPDDLVLVHAVDWMLNSKTGHKERATILSLAVSRSTLASLNLERIDPSDSMGNFVHRMDFKKTRGFAPVERLAKAEFDSASA